MSHAINFRHYLLLEAEFFVFQFGAYSSFKYNSITRWLDIGVELDVSQIELNICFICKLLQIPDLELSIRWIIKTMICFGLEYRHNGIDNCM